MIEWDGDVEYDGTCGCVDCEPSEEGWWCLNCGHHVSLHSPSGAGCEHGDDDA